MLCVVCECKGVKETIRKSEDLKSARGENTLSVQ